MGWFSFLACDSAPLLTLCSGYNMARNLQSKLPSSDTLIIQDINTDATNRFVEEVRDQFGGAAVKVAGTVREVAENAVGCHYIYPALPWWQCSLSPVLPDEYVLSMI